MTHVPEGAAGAHDLRGFGESTPVRKGRPGKGVLGRRRGRESGSPRVYVLTDAEESRVYIEVHEVATRHVDLTLAGRRLTVEWTGFPADEPPSGPRHIREQYLDGFAATVELPHRADLDRIASEMTSGMLVIRLPRAPATSAGESLRRGSGRPAARRQER